MSTAPSTTPLLPGLDRVRPGWPELLAGIATMLVLEFGLVLVVKPLGPDPVTFNVFMTALSAIVAGGGFAVAALLRVRSWSAFGVRRTSVRWLLIGLAGGLVATVLKLPLVMAWTAVFGTAANGQDTWSGLASGGVLPIVLASLFLGVATPIGEELLFRGVVTTVLLRYGSVVGVVGSAVIFALMHGISVLLVIALLVGLMAGELRRRSGSVWPGVVLHIVFDLVSSVGLFVLIPLLGA